MAIRVRCTGCDKRVSVDDAFAGGACRCPYCKEIVLVGGAPVQATGARPYAPVERPETPDEAPREQAADRPSVAREVPMANPVRLQGIVTMVLMGLMLVMVGGAIWLGIALSGSGTEDGNRPANPVPDAGPRSGQPGPGQPGGAVSGGGGGAVNLPAPAPAAEGPNAAGIKIVAPVIYVVDCGGTMKNVFDEARYLIRLSVVSLGTGTFDLVLSREAGPMSLTGPGAEGAAPAGGYRTGGPKGAAAAKAFLGISPEGTCDIGKALEGAIARRPRTIVLLRRGEVAGAKELADKAKAANVPIVAIGLASDRGAEESFSQLTGATGGQERVFSEAALSSWVDQHPLPE